MNADMQLCCLPYLTTPYFDTGSGAGACLGLIPIFLGPIAAVLESIPVVLGSIITTVLSSPPASSDTLESEGRPMSTVHRNKKIQKISPCLLIFKRYFVDLVFISEMAKGKKNRKGDESDEG
jgi:hypothetical protein